MKSFEQQSDNWKMKFQELERKHEFFMKSKTHNELEKDLARQVDELIEEND